MRHKPFRKKSSAPRKPRPPPGPARAGFTYGYQWGGEQPPDLLRFPMDFGLVKFYPVQNRELDPTFNPTGIQFLLEWPVDVKKPIGSVAAGPWHPPIALERFRLEYAREPWWDVVDDARLAVALDWHAENGFDLNPFHLSGQSWGAHKAIRDASLYTAWRDRDTLRHFPVEWMDTLVDFWRRIISDGTRAQWSKAPQELWWLDHQITSPESWYDLREKLWPRAYAEETGHGLTDPDWNPSETDGGNNDTEGLEPDEPIEPDVEGGDITTEDHEHWYQNGRLYFTGDEEGLERQMVADNFTPNVWWVSDHGNWNLLDIHGEALRIRQERLRG